MSEILGLDLMLIDESGEILRFQLVYFVNKVREFKAKLNLVRIC
jgi:hypothetical protein